MDPVALPPAREIPSAFVASVKSWWSVGEKQSAISEERLLRRLPFFRPENLSEPSSMQSPVIAHSSRVDLATPKHYINTLSITSTSPSSTAPAPAVLLHGYGAGLGFFYQNFPTLAQWAGRYGSSVYALDWLGMGRSARVPFTIKARRDDVPGRVKEAESFFVESLEEWRTKMGLDKMTLVGHSLGAYFSVVYALKYPDRVNKLVLLSPAGVPRGPNTTVPSRELTDAPETSSTTPIAEPATKDKIEELRNEQQDAKRRESKSRRLFTYLWEEGWSPFQLVRSTMFWGPMLIGKYSSRRFTGLTEEDTRDMHDYIMNITLAKGSSEYCISHILAPGVHARMPLVDRLDGPEGGRQSIENMRQAGNGNGRMYIVSNAGHHVYLDNPKAVNELILRDLKRPTPTLKSS
ncbi:alpha beta-hydrolase [Infundibulicybe gibba]|nr:alpha beta-hydrolase [Infundibulicybe gibba]